MKNKNLVLASASPRRSEILKNCGFNFTVRVKEVDETVEEKLLPQDFVKVLAQRKAEFADCTEDEIIISADSVVVLNGNIMGKPSSRENAFEMLKDLSGNTHSVFTGVCLRSIQKSVSFYCETKVTFFNLSDNDIWDYIKTGEPMDKAGAYGIQGIGGLFVSGICGDYFNVVGLPVSMLNKELSNF